MSEEREFLLMLIRKELEEEWRTCDDKDWIRNLIKAEKWLMKNANRSRLDFVSAMEIQDDIDKYLLDKQ